LKRLKVMTIVGTRPEIIRLSRVIIKLDKTTDHILVHTGQNYAYELNELFFKELELRKPDYFLEVDTGSFGRVYGDTLIKTEEILLKENPDAVLILGDTNSSLSAIIAKRLKIPVYHMEAGNRCFDLNVPEEINRKIIDHIADFNLVYTEHARRNLLAEGFPPRRIYLSGSPMKEILDHYQENIERSEILAKLKLKPREYFLLSAHREENVDRKDSLSKLLSLLEMLQSRFSKKVIVSTHPRTADRLKKIGHTNTNENIIFMKPFGYFDYVSLQKNAFTTISDSGTISEEASLLDFSAITIRNAMERPEAMDAASIVLTGLNEKAIISAIELSQQCEGQKRTLPFEYLVSDTAQRVVSLIIGTAKLSNLWAGIELNDIR